MAADDDDPQAGRVIYLPFEQQTLEQLRAELQQWLRKPPGAPGRERYIRLCRTWIRRRDQETSRHRYLSAARECIRIVLGVSENFTLLGLRPHNALISYFGSFFANQHPRSKNRRTHSPDGVRQAEIEGPKA